MKFILTLAFAYFFTIGFAQTAIIAHKSHAGTSISYLIAFSSNFGAIKVVPETWDDNSIQSKPLEIFIPLNDSVILKRTYPTRTPDFNDIDIKTDTLPNKNGYSIFEFRQKYEDSIKQIQQEVYKQQYGKQELKSQQQLNEKATPAKKKKKSYLLFLFGITGGGMLLMKLFSRSKQTEQSIA